MLSYSRLRQQFILLFIVVSTGTTARCASSLSQTHHESTQILAEADLADHPRTFTPTNHTVNQLQQAAVVLTSEWRLGSAYLFAELAGPSAKLDDVLKNVDLYSAALVVVPGRTPPERPMKGTATPFLALQEGKYSAQLSRVLPVSAINKAAASVSVSGRPLYPFRLEVLEFNISSNNSSTHGPWAIYHVPSGTVCIDKRVMDNIAELPVSMAAHVADFATQLFGHLAPIDVQQQASNTSYLAETVSSAAAAASFAAASQLPLWFCITCPIILGMLFPFAFNFGLGAIADELCTYYSLPADECTQLWYSAFALAMVLSFASVLPIVSICRLAQCAKHSSPSPNL